MSRRGEVPFVAIRVGRSNDPREVLGLAQELKLPRAHAMGIVALWEEFILEVGDALSGRVKGYAAQHLAAKVGWERSPRVLVDALKRAGVLQTQRGVFFHPYWRQSITGQYACDRAQQRETWRDEKRRQKAKREADRLAAEGSPEFRPDSAGNVPDVRPESDRKTDIKKERNGTAGAAPPPAPPPAGGSVGAARWEWMLDHHERCVRSAGCIRLLDAMTEENWALCRWVVEQSAAGGALSRSRKKRALALDSHRFIATEAFLQFRAERRQKLDQEKRPPAAPVRNVERIAKDDRLTGAIAFVLAQLADPDLSPTEKDGIRAKWAKLHPDVPAPWETAQPWENGTAIGSSVHAPS